MLIPRAARAAILDGKMYGTIKDEPENMLQALAIVAIAAGAFGLGFRNIPIISYDETSPILKVLLVASTRLIGWILWAALAYIIGTKLLRGTAGFRTLLRNIGFAFGPGILAILFEVPIAGNIVYSISLFWIFAAGMVAVHESQGYDWIRSFVASAIGWYVAFLIFPALMIPIAAPGIGPPA